jgi:hypothetical protein
LVTRRHPVQELGNWTISGSTHDTTIGWRRARESL